MPDTEQVDVVIVGGGLAGLAAADWIKQANQFRTTPLSFVVLEGRERLGGRADTDRNYFELGSGYIGATQQFMQALVLRFGIFTFREYLPDDKFWLYQDQVGKKYLMPGNNPFALPGGAPSLRLLVELDQMAAGMRAVLHNPFLYPNAQALEQITVEQWIHDWIADWNQNNPSTPALLTKDLFQVAIRSAFSADIDELSFLYLLYYSASAGGFSALVDVTGGEGTAEGTRFTFGVNSVVNALAGAVCGAALPPDPTSVIRLNHKVTDIEQRLVDDKEVVDVTAQVGQGTKTFRAGKVIVAMSPNISGKINFGSNIQGLAGWGDRDRLQKETKMGRTIKGFVKYRWPFWRVQGQMGFALSARDFNNFPLDWTLDNCWEPKEYDFNTPAPDGLYSLMTFIVGKSADLWGAMTVQQRANAVITHLEDLYGPVARSALLDPSNPSANYIENNWQTEPFSDGAPTGLPHPGTFLNNFAALRKPVGLVHWAGTESASSWCGYMNGAVESGIRAANEVL